MPKYIDADALIALLKKTGDELLEIDEIAEGIDMLPAADVEPVRRGRWDGEGDGYADGEIVLDVWHCSLCGHCIDDGTDDPEFLPNYCPGCGGRMSRGGKDD